LGQLLANKTQDANNGNNPENNPNGDTWGGHNDHYKEEEIHTNPPPKHDQPPPSGASSVSEDVIKDIQAQIASLSQRDRLRKAGMTRPYPLEWDSVLYLPRFKPPMLHSYDDKSSPNQHVYYFWSQTGDVIGNATIMTQLFISTLKGTAFDWFWSLPAGSVNSWANLETMFLSLFFEDDIEVTLNKLLEAKQKSQEPVKDFIKRFRNLSLLFPVGMPLSMLLQKCRHNFQNKVEDRMVAVKAHTWKDLVEHVETTESSVNKRDPPTPKPK
jgi:hypothetical protein